MPNRLATPCKTSLLPLESYTLTLIARDESQACHLSNRQNVPTAMPVFMQVNLPSWVNFPDFERVGWLNSVLGRSCNLCYRCYLLSQQDVFLLMQPLSPSAPAHWLAYQHASCAAVSSKTALTDILALSAPLALPQYSINKELVNMLQRALETCN